MIGRPGRRRGIADFELARARRAGRELREWSLLGKRVPVAPPKPRRRRSR